jgi:transposase
MGYVGGQSRAQGALFPVALDDMVGEDHAVRVIDAFVAGLDLGPLGFQKAQPAATGRPPYDPGDLLRLYLYGYLNQVRSSRRLERECARNVEGDVASESPGAGPQDDCELQAAERRSVQGGLPLVRALLR